VSNLIAKIDLSISFENLLNEVFKTFLNCLPKIF